MTLIRQILLTNPQTSRDTELVLLVASLTVPSMKGFCSSEVTPSSFASANVYTNDNKQNKNPNGIIARVCREGVFFHLVSTKYHVLMQTSYTGLAES